MSSKTIKTKSITISGGWLSNARQVPSPNYNARPCGEAISLLVIHNISLPPEQFGNGYVEQFFCNQLDCSIHPYLRGGELIQFVPFDRRAWHAGASSFKDRNECNDFSIGIELEGADTIPYTDAQYALLAEITKALINEYPDISRDTIVGHCDISPGRKTDPGESFDWQNYLNRVFS